jgi:hypothetical protein
VSANKTESLSYLKIAEELSGDAAESPFLAAALSRLRSGVPLDAWQKAKLEEMYEDSLLDPEDEVDF